MATTARRLAAAMGVFLLSACVSAPQRTAATLASVYSDDGLSELSAPDTWRTRPNLNRTGTIRIGDDETLSYLVVNSYLPHELDGTPFAQFAERVSGRLTKNLNGATMSAPRSFALDGRPALEYEISGANGRTPLVYLSTIVDGQKARHHLVTWTLAERYRANGAAMRAAVASFRESAQARAPKTRTDLTFDWPERMSATATVRSKSAKRGEVLEMSMRATSTVRPLDAQHLLISVKVSDRKFNPVLRDPGKAEYLERLLKEATADVPDYVVDRDGEFVRTENIAPYLKRVEDALAASLPEAPQEARAKASQLVKSLINERTLNALMEDEWNNIVGNWADASYVPGEIYVRQSTYQSPALGGREFPMHMTQQLAGPVPCRKGAAADSCVRLLQSARVSNAEFTRATSAFVRKTVGEEVSVDAAEVVKSVEVIADPDTLLPYRTVVKETKTFTVSAKGAAPRKSEETSETVTTYSY